MNTERKQNYHYFNVIKLLYKTKIIHKDHRNYFNKIAFSYTNCSLSINITKKS